MTHNGKREKTRDSFQRRIQNAKRVAEAWSPLPAGQTKLERASNAVSSVKFFVAIQFWRFTK